MTHARKLALVALVGIFTAGAAPPAPEQYCHPPGNWQSVEVWRTTITLRCERDGKVKARLIRQNGVPIGWGPIR